MMTPTRTKREIKEELLALLTIKAERVQRQRIAHDADAIRSRCKTLAGFVREAWHVLEPTTTYSHNWHIEAVCAHLEAVTAGRINRLLINIPPGFSKSLIVSVFWPAWEWAMGYRSMRYLTSSFAIDSVKRDTRKHRDLIASTWYQTLWPDVVLVRSGETSFANRDTGTREGVAFGSLTSKRGDRLILDDVHSTKTAESDLDREKTTRQFREGATNRLNDQERSAIVVVMQRLHERDVSGTILSVPMPYVHLNLPMEFEPERACATSIGWRDPRTVDGELLDPHRFPANVVADLKRDGGSHFWAGQYQQRPVPREGGMFKREWFKVLRARPAGIVKVVRAWDFGATEGGGDFTAAVRCEMTDDRRFIFTNVKRGQYGPAGVESLFCATAASDGPGVTIRIPQDPGAAGKSYAAMLVRMVAGYPIKVVAPTGDKETRATALAAQAEAGNVYVLMTGDAGADAWVEQFVEELCTFPSGAHDDVVDAAADALTELALGPGDARVFALKL